MDKKKKEKKYSFLPYTCTNRSARSVSELPLEFEMGQYCVGKPLYLSVREYSYLMGPFVEKEDGIRCQMPD